MIEGSKIRPAALLLTCMAVAACGANRSPQGDASSVTTEQARAAFCGRVATRTPETKAGFEADALLFEQAGDDETAAKLRGALETFPSDTANDLAIFLEDNITLMQASSLEARLHDIAGTANVSFETKQVAAEHFKEMFKDEPELINNLDVEAMPESFRVHALSAESAEEVRALAQSSPGVMKVVEQAVHFEDTLALQEVLDLQKEICGQVAGL